MAREPVRDQIFEAKYRPGAQQDSDTLPAPLGRARLMLGLRLARAVSGPRRVLGSRRAALVAVPTRTFAKDTSAEHTPAEVFEAALASAPVVVFSRSWCPFCKQLAVLFEEVMPLDLRVAHIGAAAYRMLPACPHCQPGRPCAAGCSCRC